METSSCEGKNAPPWPFPHSKQDTSVYLPAALLARLWREALAVAKGALAPPSQALPAADPSRHRVSGLTSYSCSSGMRDLHCFKVFLYCDTYLWATLSICRIFTFLAMGNLLSSHFCGSSLPLSPVFKIFVEMEKARPAWNSSPTGTGFSKTKEEAPWVLLWLWLPRGKNHIYVPTLQSWSSQHGSNRMDSSHWTPTTAPWKHQIFENLYTWLSILKVWI